VRLLLDTHSFLWFILGDSRLSAGARSLIENADNERWLSMASAWEMAIKVSLGKMNVFQPFDTLLATHLQRNNVFLLPISLPHVLRVVTLPFHHRDPFDRMIAVQSLSENLPLVSADSVFDNYGVQRLW
jgi:PIN domain nuclease of toxin-antitoxin system